MPRKATFESDTKATNDDTPKTIEEKRHEAVSGVLQIIQFGCIASGNFSDAGAIGLHGEPFGNEVVSLAGENKFIAGKLDLLIEAGPYAGLIATAIPFAVQILCNHNVRGFKADQWANAGVVSSESLEYQMKTQIMRQQMESLAAQKAAEEELSRMQSEMAESSNGDNPDRESKASNVE